MKQIYKNDIVKALKGAFNIDCSTMEPVCHSYQVQYLNIPEVGRKFQIMTTEVTKAIWYNLDS